MVCSSPAAVLILKLSPSAHAVGTKEQFLSSTSGLGGAAETCSRQTRKKVIPAMMGMVAGRFGPQLTRSGTGVVEMLTVFSGKESLHPPWQGFQGRGEGGFGGREDTFSFKGDQRLLAIRAAFVEVRKYNAEWGDGDTASGGKMSISTGR
jgi:hypothetical protein